MTFRSGSVSYARFRLFGEGAEDGMELLGRLAEHALRPTPGSDPPELEAGWVAGRHILDLGFSAEENLFGDLLLAGLRVDTNRVPPEVRRAYRAMAETERGRASETGFLGRAEKLMAREEADRQCGTELADGRHRRSKLVPVLWNRASGTFLAPATGDAVLSVLREVLNTSTGLRLQGRTAGSLAWDLLADRGLANDLDDALPSSFTPPPPQAAIENGERRRADGGPEVPWAFGGPEPKDFLGNEFLLWLWWRCEEAEGMVDTTAGPVAVTIDRTLEMDCAWGASGRQSLRGDAVTRLPEAGKALALGKWPRRCGLIVATGDEQWELTFQADGFRVASAKLPAPEDRPASVREAMEQRVQSILALDDALVALFDAFLRVRFAAGWETHRDRIASWIATRGQAPTAAPHGAEIEITARNDALRAPDGTAPSAEGAAASVA